MKPLYSRFSSILLTAVLVITLNISAKTQTTLSMGDIAFTGYRSADATDNFSFVLLVSVQAGTVINFTDNGWLSPGSWRGGETVTILTTLALPAGREILISGTTATQAGSGASAGNVTGSALSLATSGDQIFAYQGASTFISGIHMNVAGTNPPGPCADCANSDNTNWDGSCANSSNGSWKPPVLNGAGTSALFLLPTPCSGTESDNAKFVNNGNNLLGTPAQVKAALANPANWLFSDGSPGVPAFTLPTNLTYLGLFPLPVSLVSFTGKLNSDKTITLQWKVEAQQDIQEYIVEESTDGTAYRQLGSVAAGTGNTDTYSYTDMQVATGNNYYRLKTVELSGKIAYSDVVVVNLKSGIKVSVYPNPVTDKLIIQQFGTIQNKTAVLLDGGGKTLQQIKLTNLQQDISIKGYPAGIYIVKMEDGTVFKIVKQ